MKETIHFREMTYTVHSYKIILLLSCKRRTPHQLYYRTHVQNQNGAKYTTQLTIVQVRSGKLHAGCALDTRNAYDLNFDHPRAL
jgi:hypothetical protein